MADDAEADAEAPPRRNEPDLYAVLAGAWLRV
jgi:hypothetical protein